MTLLSIVQNVCKQIPLDVPGAVVASTDPQVRQLWRLADQEGKDLVRRHGWQILTTEKTFTTVAAEAQTDTPLSADFDRFCDGTAYNRSLSRELVGPITEKQWQHYKATSTSAWPGYFRLRGDSFLIYPAPSAGETIAYEYISSYWVDTEGDGTAAQTGFTADADAAVLREELITLGVVWRFLKANNLDYTEEHRNYQMAVQDAIARDGGTRSLDLGAGSSMFRPGVHAPDGNWNL